MTAASKMDSLFKQFTTTVGGMINMAQATMSPYKVQSTDFETYKRYFNE